MSIDRDTHFQGSAKLLHDRLATLPYIPHEGKGFTERMRKIISQYAYDLALHTIQAYDGVSLEFAIEMIDHVPDMTQWPKETG